MHFAESECTHRWRDAYSTVHQQKVSKVSVGGFTRERRDLSSREKKNRGGSRVN